MISEPAGTTKQRSAQRGHAKPIDKELLQIHPWVMGVKVAVFVSLLTIGCAGILSGYVAGAVLGTLLLGAMFAHGVELTHQFLHGTGFRGRRLNRVSGFLCALPMLVSHSHYRALHLAHHRNLGTPANSEFFNYGNVKGRPFLVVLARSFSLGRFPRVARNILGALRGKMPEGVTNQREGRAIRLEYLAMLVVIVGVIVFTAVTGSWLAVRLWVIPLLLVAEPVHFWVELPEHFGCDLTTRNVLLNTRTIRGSWLSFWFTNGNNFHVEHHLYPRVAIDKLPRVYAALGQNHQFFNQSYWSFLGTVLSPEVAPLAAVTVTSTPSVPSVEIDDDIEVEAGVEAEGVAEGAGEGTTESAAEDATEGAIVQLPSDAVAARSGATASYAGEASRDSGLVALARNSESKLPRAQQETA